jgi:hypothetical protein
MRPILICLLALAGCRGILHIPSEGKVGCPSPCRVSVSGVTRPAKSVSTSLSTALANVTVDLASLEPAPEVITGADGAYSFPGLEPETPIAFRLSVPQDEPGVPDLQGLLPTIYVAGATAMENVSLDLPVVQFKWLAQVAVQCGIFTSLDKALFQAGTKNINNYFTKRATIVGQVLENKTTPAKLNRVDISVEINGFVNHFQNPADTDPFPATLCFLEPDPSTGEYRGVNAPQTSSGLFVMFRASNDVNTGSGTGKVEIPGFPPGDLDVSSGTIGFVHIQRDVGEGLPARRLTFERDVYPFFAKKTCSSDCHRPGGAGYEMAPERQGPNGTYRADWSASVEAVYDNLTKPFDTNCAQGGDLAARVCLAMPTASLLYRKPSGLIYHSGFNFGTRDEMVVNILQWIQDGVILR